ncbi:MAG: serine/threonine protein kinase [Planctomycetia bacterium]|nr:serine/threonine protein kinase [Planctomycetia bacterium]
MSEPNATLVQKPKISPPLQVDPLPLVSGYEMIKVLGQGGMGKVYLALHLQQNRLVALKVVTSPSQHVEDRFQQEILAIASLKHHHIAQIYENGQVEGRPYYSMEYLAGGTLSQRLKEAVLTPQQAARVIIQLAHAMHYAHSQGILHRDLKPGNVLLEKTNDNSIVPKIADFGLAKRMLEDAQLTQTGDLFGSPSYMSPEQASGISKLTPATDIYALGAILYECLTGRPPFLGTDPMQTMLMVLSDDPLPPRQLQPQLPRDLNTICMKCLEKLPKKRFESAEALALELERFLSGEPIQARPVGPVERLVKWARRRPWQAAAVALTLALMMALAAGLAYMQHANQQISNAKDNATEAYTLSRDSLISILKNNTELLSTLPQAEQLTIESYRPVIELFRSLDKLRPDDRPTILARLETLYQYFVTQVLYHRHDDARNTLVETTQLLQTKLVQFPQDTELKLYQIKHLINQGWLARRQSKPAEAQISEKQAQGMLEEFLKLSPNDTRFLKLSIDLLNNQIGDAIAEQKFETALEHYRSIVEFRKTIFQEEPDGQNASLLMGSQKSLATFLLATRRFDEAEKLLLAIQTQLPRLQIPDADKLNQQALLNISFGDVARSRQAWKPAEEFYAKASRVMQSLRTQFPLNSSFLYDDLSIQGKLIELNLERGNITIGLPQLRSFVTMVDKMLEEHPEYTSIASMQRHYRALLQKLESSRQQ